MFTVMPESPTEAQAESVESQVGPAQESTPYSRVPRGSRINVIERLATWVSIVTALVSLAISLYTLVVTSNAPEVALILPNQVRITQGGTSGPLLYIQPMFISTGPSDRVEVVTAIRVQVAPVDHPNESADFVWDEQGTWVVDADTQNFSWAFTGDSGPFLVGPKNAQFFTGLFIGPQEWLFAPGTYRITMMADRITNAQPLAASLDIVLSTEELEYLHQSGGRRFLTFPTIR